MFKFERRKLTGNEFRCAYKAKAKADISKSNVARPDEGWVYEVELRHSGRKAEC